MRRALALALACLLMFSVAGCGPAPDPEARDGEMQAPIVFRRGNGPEPETLDPQRAQDENSRDIIRDLYEGLVAETSTGELVPGAASSWAVSDDGLEWTFELRPDGRWSNGDALTAADFVAGFRRAVDPATASTEAGLLMPVAGAGAIIAGEAPPETLGVRAPAPHRLVLTLARPTPYLLGLLTHPITFPAHRPSLAEHGNGFARPGRMVSNGAYRLDAWEPQSHVHLVRNEFFRERPQVDEVRFMTFDLAEAELNHYRTDALDYTSQIPLARFEWLQENLGDELRLAPALTAQYWLFNTLRPPTDDLRVRQALAMAVDRQQLVEAVLGSGDRPAYGLVPPGVLNYASQSFAWRDLTMAQRIEQARALLAEAGYGPDNPLRLTVHYNTDDNLRRVAIAVTSMWREHLGVEAALHNEEFRVMLSRRRNPDQWQVLRLSWRGDYNDASNFLEILTPTGAVPDTGWDDEEYVRLLEAAAREQDPAERRALLEAAERRMLEFVPILPLYHPVSKHLAKPWLRGDEPNILNRTYTRNISIDVAQRGF
ncbi:peptide ABC transporter substrate-binding protein [Thioalkalivibrio sp. XN8]|uniref:peptide ABC transporter substrate-binding protein n=1 Tax=Thioalkalivibrio sp. XN8 TaxID=2712863 RepID=UPI0013ED0062|nr:peptide ABC transporter substrate-binding protein [Thioalkalivibrio sp. XN8]NGP52091.1 peptide ABC transporter substrate-binding protein [Thioalkalivibrio sp. XN8]